MKNIRIQAARRARRIKKKQRNSVRDRATGCMVVMSGAGAGMGSSRAREVRVRARRRRCSSAHD